MPSVIGTEANSTGAEGKRAPAALPVRNASPCNCRQSPRAGWAAETIKTQAKEVPRSQTRGDASPAGDAARRRTRRPRKSIGRMVDGGVRGGRRGSRSPDARPTTPDSVIGQLFDGYQVTTTRGPLGSSRPDLEDRFDLDGDPAGKRIRPDRTAGRHPGIFAKDVAKQLATTVDDRGLLAKVISTLNQPE